MKCALQTSYEKSTLVRSKFHIFHKKAGKPKNDLPAPTKRNN